MFGLGGPGMIEFGVVGLTPRVVVSHLLATAGLALGRSLPRAVGARGLECPD